MPTDEKTRVKDVNKLEKKGKKKSIIYNNKNINKNICYDTDDDNNDNYNVDD